MDTDFKHFLTFWLAGLINGLEQVDDTAQQTILRACGRGCADSYTAQVFTDVKQQSADFNSFLTNLSPRFPEAIYERTSPREIRVTYAHCACDLVRRGLTQSPIICHCSAYNLQANFERVFKPPIDLTIQSSILRGDQTCRFVVSLPHDIEDSF